jgi:DNA/RNA endonuclease G (NUC1)
MIRYLILCLIFFSSCSKQDSSSVKTENENNSNTSSLTRARVDSLLVSNNIFQISYNEKYEQPNWVKYTVRDIVKNADRDGMQFYTVDSVYTSDDDDYYANVWDRGHMAPAGSFNDSYENLYSTFSYLNVALQYDDLNRGTWVQLEEQVRQWADELGDIDIEIYLEFDSSHIVLDTGAHVPTAFYKHVIFPDSSKKCYYFPNSTPDKSWQEYEIECN